MTFLTTLGTDEGYAEPGVAGAQNPFPQENLHSVIYQRLAENRLAGLGNKTLDYHISQNDVVAAHRAVYTSRQSARSPRLLVAFSPSAGQAYDQAGVPANARAGTGTILDGTGKAMASAGSVTRVKSLAVVATNGNHTFNPGTGRGNEIFAQWLTLGDTDLAGGNKFAVRMTDANNWISFYRQAAGNIRTERNVASVTATERDTTIPTSTPATGNAMGIRLSGTSAALFLNGTKIDEWTLNAGAQGLAGTLAGWIIAAQDFGYLDYMEVWSLTPVNGV